MEIFEDQLNDFTIPGCCAWISVAQPEIAMRATISKNEI